MKNNLGLIAGNLARHAAAKHSNEFDPECDSCNKHADAFRYWSHELQAKNHASYLGSLTGPEILKVHLEFQAWKSNRNSESPG